MTLPIDEWNAFRAKMNDRIFAAGNLPINRFFRLDGQAYEAGALGEKAKELMGLVASLVLRCDDCVTYHILEAIKHDATDCRSAFAHVVVMMNKGLATTPATRPIRKAPPRPLL